MNCIIKILVDTQTPLANAIKQMPEWSALYHLVYCVITKDYTYRQTADETHIVSIVGNRYNYYLWYTYIVVQIGSLYAYLIAMVAWS